MATPHTRQRECTQACRVRAHTFDLVCKTHGRERRDLHRDGTLLRRNFVKIDEYNRVPSLFFVVDLCFLLFFERRERERDVTLNLRNFSRGLSKKTISKEKKNCLLLWEFSSLIDLQLKYTYARREEVSWRLSYSKIEKKNKLLTIKKVYTEKCRILIKKCTSFSNFRNF